MTVYVIDNKQQPNLAKVTVYDIKLHDPHLNPIIVNQEENPADQLKALAQLDLNNGDIICFSGLVLRPMTWAMIDHAVNLQKNLMPGQTVDHRLIKIEQGKFFRRRTQEQNEHTGIAYLMIIGDAAGAIESWNTVLELPPEEIWSKYLPETLSVQHWLSAAAELHSSWITPNWFKIVDMSIRDLELAPVMYASNRWEDWIAFYPANGNFKLENHSQLNPVWLDSSEKPLEYWKNG